MDGFDLSDPLERALWAEQIRLDNEEKQAELQRDIAERQERRSAGLDREWHVPRPNPLLPLYGPRNTSKRTRENGRLMSRPASPLHSAPRTSA